MVLRSGPMIEGVVSPTASKTTRTNALDNLQTTNRASLNDMAGYYSTQKSFQDGANTSTAGALAGQFFGQDGLNTLATAIGSGFNPNSVATVQLAGQGGGWVDNGDGTFHNIYSGQTSTGNTGAPGGGGGGGTAPVSDPNTGQAPGGPAGGDTLRGASREAIDAQINALTAQYGLDLDSLAALGGEIGAQAKFLLAQLGQDQQYAQEGLTGNLVGRGIYRSGITARDTGRLENKFANQRAQVEMNKGTQLRQLAERAGIAKAGLARGKADVISEIDRANLGAEMRQLLLNELNSLRPEDIQDVIAKNALPTAIGGLGIAQ